jgi:Family of unknown function (DUF5681)
MPPEAEYQVGYKRPPAHTRFRKGQSGNPRGRRRGSKNWQTLFLEALAAKVSVNEDGRRLRISKQQAMFAQLANRAAQGDARATQMVLRVQAEIERKNKAEAAVKTGPVDNGSRPRQRHLVVLPDNGRDPLHPELLRLHSKLEEEGHLAPSEWERLTPENPDARIPERWVLILPPPVPLDTRHRDQHLRLQRLWCARYKSIHMALCSKSIEAGPDTVDRSRQYAAAAPA